MPRKSKIVGWKKLVPTGTNKYDKNVSWAFKNNIYTVFVRVAENEVDGKDGAGPEGEADGVSAPSGVLWLSFKRNDRKAVQVLSECRDIQLIKNEIAGPKTDSVMLFPSEDRLKDSANQYHLYCVPPGEIIPIGMGGGRAVADPGITEEREFYIEDATRRGYRESEARHFMSKSKQQPFQEHHLPVNVPTQGWMKWNNIIGWHSSFFLENKNGECQLVLEPGQMTEEQRKLVNHLIARGYQ